MPREVRLSTEPSPVTATATTSAIPSTTTITNSTPTAAALTKPTMRVEAMASTAWIEQHDQRDQRARCPRPAAMPNSGMNAWLASALSTATTAIARYQKVNHPNPQPTFGLASREAHW